MHIEHELVIQAPVAVVWQLTEGIEAWPAMSPTMTRIERLDDGPLHVGSRARVKQPRQRPTIWTVTRIEPDTSFVWQAKVFGVTMVAAHALTDVDGNCLNRLTIDATGRGAGLLARIAAKKIAAALQTENEGFKREAEVLVAQGTSR